MCANKRKGEGLEVAAARVVGSGNGRCLCLRDCSERASRLFLFVCLFVNPIRVEEEEDGGDMMMNVYWELLQLLLLLLFDIFVNCSWIDTR